MSARLVGGRYEVERPLGHGAFATVDLARDVELDRPVALKRLADNLSRDDDLRARFLREARLAARLSHPNVVRVYDVGDDGERPFIAMEYVDGQTLGDLVARGGPLPPEEVIEIGVQACRALAAAHEAGLVHRDVKSHNLFLQRDGTLKLGDFGIAVGLEGTRLTAAGTVMGTAAYLAPEQARGEEVTAAADLFALGVVLVELLTGSPDRNARLEGPLGGVVRQCLAEDPSARPASAADLAAALAAARADTRTLPIPERPTRIATQIKATPRKARHRTTYVLVAVAIAALAGGTAAAIESGGGTPAPPPPAKVQPVQPGSSAEQEARNLAAWLERYSG